MQGQVCAGFIAIRSYFRFKTSPIYLKEFGPGALAASRSTGVSKKQVADKGNFPGWQPSHHFQIPTRVGECTQPPKCTPTRASEETRADSEGIAQLHSHLNKSCERGEIEV